jgi:cytochrome c-type biogenesis protein CcmH
MTTFTIIAALMILLALAMLAPALLRKREMAASDRDQQNVIIARERLQEMERELEAGKINQDEFDQTKVELEQALLLDLKEEDGPKQVTTGPGKLTMGILAVAVPLLAVYTYLMLGSPQMVEFDAAKHASQTSKKQGQMPSVDEMVVALKKRLQEKPDDAQGWFLLGRTYMAMEKYPLAAEAYEALLKITGDEPTIMLSLAEAITFSNKGSMQGRPAELIRKTLEISPDNQSAIWMGGLLESQEGNYSKALELWRRLEPKLAQDPAAQEKLRQLIKEIEKKQSENPKLP